MSSKDISIGDVVQLDPEKTSNIAFSECLMIVTEVKSFGVTGYVPDIGRGIDERSGSAPYRALNGTYKLVGKASWTKMEVRSGD